MKRKDINRVYVMLLCMMCWCLSASAQESHTLDNIEVVSRHTFSDIIPSQNLSGKQLENLNALSVADALRYFSGLQVKDYGGVGGLKTVNIRSMGSQHLGVYYDGIQLGNAQNGQTDLGQFSLDNVEEISLYNGQKSSLMQTASDYGNAGNIYIRTRIPKFKATEHTHFRGKVKYGSSNLLQIAALLEQKISDRISVSFDLGTLTSDGKYKFRYSRKNSDGTVAYDTTAIRQNGDVQTIRLEGNLHGLMERGSWYLKAYTYQSNRGIPGAIVNNVWKRAERQVDSNTFFQGAYQKDPCDWYSFRVMGKYANYYTHYQNPDTTTMMVDNKYRQQEAYVSTSHAFEILPWWSSSIAYDVRWSKLTSDMYTCPEPYRWTHMIAIASAVSFRKFSAQASILYNNTRDKGESSAAGTIPVGATLKISRFTPALFMQWYPLRTRDFSIRGFVKNNFRMPTFNDLYYAEVGNSNLRPEKAIQYDLGATYTAKIKSTASVSLKADGYYNVVHDKIIAYPKGQQFRWTMLNLGKVHITGLDFEAYGQMQISKVKAGLRLQYTYQRAIDVTDENDSYYKHQIPYIPEHSGSAIADIEWKAFTFVYSFIYTGKRYNQQENIERNYMEPWYTSDCSLSYSMPVKKTLLKATLEVNNIFSQDYDVILNYPMPKRNYAISLSLQL